jgi:serine/threonine protein kinase
MMKRVFHNSSLQILDKFGRILQRILAVAYLVQYSTILLTVMRLLYLLNLFVLNFQAFSTVGTPDYIAPEVLQKKGYGMECDWY